MYEFAECRTHLAISPDIINVALTGSLKFAFKTKEGPIEIYAICASIEACRADYFDELRHSQEKTCSTYE